ncbi:uncharacterized protein PV09_03708 [Verruconis gallopava]|uniref:Gfd2/YDR514C-like C-terminal domain-containing protein n=1 Tax=Verruconis gallopava TaxID=253628 RepID=A0A0D1YWR9_9PEZI|nr:uncharacterized protein PV09_03708 [Verruconis gallopava]KIW05157.1 hypothetical protein PV09_03708 [Verruconis gallopava]
MSIYRTSAVAHTQAMLGLPNPDGTKPPHVDKIIASVDVEDLSCNRNWPILEVGIARLDTRNVYNLDPETHDDLEYLKHIEAYHFRFQEVYHMRNTARWLSADYDRADRFLYGKSEIITREQLQSVISQLLHVQDTQNQGAYRDVHMITQGGTHDLTNLGKFAKPKFNFTEVVPNMTLEELQITARNASMSIFAACNGQRPSIEKITRGVGLECLLLHNAGNDAVTQLACNIKLALQEYRERTTLSEQQEEAEMSQNDESQNAKGLAGQAHSEGYALFKPNFYHLLEDEADLVKDDSSSNAELQDDSKQQEDDALRLMYKLSGYLKDMPSQPIVGWIVTANPSSNSGRVEDRLELTRLKNYQNSWAKDVSRGRTPKPYIPLAQTNLSEKDHVLESEEGRAAISAARQEAALAKALQDAQSFPALPSNTRPSSSSAQALSNNPATFWANWTPAFKAAGAPSNRFNDTPP